MNISAEDYGLTLAGLPRPDLLEQVFQLARSEKVSRYMEWQPHQSPKDTQIFFDFCAEEKKSGTGFHFLVHDNRLNCYLGVASLSPVDLHNRKGEVTTWLGQEYFGLGYNKKIKHVLFQYAFRQLRLNKLVFRVSTDNTASIKSHKKLCTVLEGTLRQELRIRGELKDFHYFGLLAEEYFLHYPELKLGIID